MLTDVGGLAPALFAIRFAEARHARAHLRILSCRNALAASTPLCSLGIRVDLGEFYERLRTPPSAASKPHVGHRGAGALVNVVGPRSCALGHAIA